MLVEAKKKRTNKKNGRIRRNDFRREDERDNATKRQADDGFVDDIPWENDIPSKKPSGRRSWSEGKNFRHEKLSPLR